MSRIGSCASVPWLAHPEPRGWRKKVRPAHIQRGDEHGQQRNRKILLSVRSQSGSHPWRLRFVWHSIHGIWDKLHPDINMTASVIWALILIVLFHYAWIRKAR